MTTTTTEAKTSNLEAMRSAFAAGDRNRAIDLAIRALEQNIRDPDVLELVADGMEEDGHLESAVSLLYETSEADPSRFTAHRALCRVLVKLDRHEEGRAALLRLLAVDDTDLAAHLEAAHLSMLISEVPAARHHATRGAELAPDDAVPQAMLATIAARRGDAASARAFGERALALNPQSIGAQIAIGRAELIEGKPAAARERLERLLTRADLSDSGRADVLNYVADALDAQDLPDEAFGLYAARSAVQRRSLNATLKEDDKARGVAQARRLVAYFNAHASPPVTAGEDREGAALVTGHIFMVGFPRSGTTLLEQVLGSHPRIVTLEERRMLADATDRFLTDNTATDQFMALDQTGVDACRKIYWDGVRQAFTGVDFAGKILIDKNPLNTARLPVIAKLFPRAKIIFALRDPRDVVFSCYRRLYYSMMLEFNTLEGTAGYYDQVMTLGGMFRERLPLAFHTVKHEDLVADFDAEARAVLEFVGAGWDEAVRGFATRAADSATPSAGQVARGLNSEGVGQWRRYAKQLAPILQTLEPWVKRFGYPETPPELKPTVADQRLGPILDKIGEAVRTQNWATAFNDVNQALAQGLRHPFLYRLRGIQGQQQGQLDQAIADFETALIDNPGDFATLNALGLCLARAGRFNEGLARLEAAIAIAPDFAPARYNRGWTLEAMGDMAGARQAYLQAVGLDPSHAQALGNLAALAGRLGDYAEARAYASRALALDSGQPSALTALATAETAESEAQQAARRLAPLIAPGSRASGHERAIALGVLGDALDAQDLPADAFKAYAASGAALRDLYARSDFESSSQVARRLKRQFVSARPADWRRPRSAIQTGGADGHLFLLGFPRSGTTMLGQALATHPDVVTLEERDFLADAVRRLLVGEGGPERLAALDAQETARFAKDYWDRIDASGVQASGKMVVDRLPMNTLALPVITKLFPAAKILFLRRDPRDVVLSCFRRRFAINPTTVEFLTVEGAAAHYDAVMDLAQTYEAVLDLDLRVQGYETLVGNFEAEMRALCGFAGLSWRVDMVDFGSRSGDIATPSASQIARGLNTEGVGQWRRYRSELAPVMPVLARWVERFGYDSE